MKNPTPPPTARRCRPRRCDSGATALEWVGVALVAAAVIAAIVAVVSPDSVRTTMATALCRILSQEGCPTGSTPPGSEPEKTPYEKATWGSVWFGGDSFASGEGTNNYDPETNITDSDDEAKNNKCHRSPHSYQAQVFKLAQSKGAFAGQKYSTEACSGAIVSDLYSDNHSNNADEGPQMYDETKDPATDDPFDNVPEDASLISFSLGGNDIGFADVLENCVTEFTASGCEDSDSLTTKMNEVYGTSNSPGSLEQQVAKLKREHPDARIVLMGYPSLFAAEKDLKKGPLTTMSVAEQKWANEMAVAINEAGREMADRQGIEWIDPTSAFVGPGYDHRVGSEDPYINDLALKGLSANPESFHPNQKGHDAMSGLLWQQITEGPR